MTTCHHEPESHAMVLGMSGSSRFRSSVSRRSSSRCWRISGAPSSVATVRSSEPMEARPCLFVVMVRPPRSTGSGTESTPAPLTTGTAAPFAGVHSHRPLRMRWLALRDRIGSDMRISPRASAASASLSSLREADPVALAVGDTDLGPTPRYARQLVIVAHSTVTGIDATKGTGASSALRTASSSASDGGSAVAPSPPPRRTSRSRLCPPSCMDTLPTSTPSCSPRDSSRWKPCSSGQKRFTADRKTVFDVPTTDCHAPAMWSPSVGS
mmetsp:Transcript_13424/g.41758  ORF Transcript_13424/g.41758 Transcript_13424/m.41758 type:complete len:268 (-) Transcript_13424:283-1086(-)